MDGASKFVKGDAMAGVLIVSINLIGGIVVGVVEHHLSFSDAIHRFSLLTVGDGLAAQIPALLISTATGVIVTRSGSETNLGSEITAQLLGQPRATTLAGGVIAAMGLVPGLPMLPFMFVGGMLILLGRTVGKQKAIELASAKQTTLDAETVPTDPLARALQIDPLELSLGFGLVPMVDQRAGGGLLARVGLVRRQIATDLGIVIAPVRIHDDAALDSHEYVMKVRGAEVARGKVIPGHRLAMNPGDAIEGLTGIPTIEPAFGLAAVWIDDRAQGEAEALGYTVVDSESVIVTHLTETIRRHADELLTRQETRKLLDELKERNLAAVEEIVPDKLSVGEVQRALQYLLREGVSIRDLGTILEAIGDRALHHSRPGSARGVRAPGARADDHGVLPGRREDIACDLVRLGARARGCRVACPDPRGRSARPRSGPGPRRAGIARRARRARDHRRSPSGRALLEPHSPAYPPAR